MIRRKIWATATCCLALAGAARAQTGSTPKATIGVPKAESPAYIARGVAPNPGYPKFVPRNYTAPISPTYGTPVADLAPATPNVVPEPTEQFAVDSDAADPAILTAQPPATPPVGSPMPGTIMGPTPSVVESPMVTPGAVPPATVSMQPMDGSPIYNGPILNGGPISDTPFLDATCMNGEGAMPIVWASGEFLSWQYKGVSIPPLITTAPAGSPGTLNDANTSVLFGGSGMLRDWNPGYRVRAGFWFPDGCTGVDLGYFSIGTNTKVLSLQSDGGQGLFRPIFNTAFAAEDASLVAFTDPVFGPIVAGRVGVTYDTLLWGAEANCRMGWGMGLGGRLDALIGYRYLQMHDSITVGSSVTVQPGAAALGGPQAGTVINSFDAFDAKNEFHGGQVGIVGEWQLGMLTLGVRGTVAMGVVTQDVSITGSTTTALATGAVTSPGGLLALPGTNMGDHQRQRFSVVPEIGVTLGYQCTNNIRIFAGYNLLCWTNVVRAGEQINRNVNPSFIADPATGVVAPSGAPAPTFHHRDEKFYAHGYSIGVEFRW